MSLYTLLFAKQATRTRDASYHSQHEHPSKTLFKQFYQTSLTVKTIPLMVFGLLLSISSASAQVVNLAKGKSVKQSSTGWGGVATRGNDGQVTDFMHTANGDNMPYWEVDLGGMYSVTEIRIVNRTDCCSERIDGANIILSDRVEPLPTPNGLTTPHKRVIPVKGVKENYVFPMQTHAGAPTIPVRHVRIQLPKPGYLHFKELQVLGYAQKLSDGASNNPFNAIPKNLPAGVINLAPGKAVKQSSTGWGGTATRAIDNKFTDFIHTANGDSMPYWEVDLGGRYKVSDVRIINRTDCCSERLEGANIILSDSPLPNPNGLQAKSKHVIPITNAQLDNLFSVTAIAGGKAPVVRYVRVQLPKAGYLHFNELQVFGYPNVVSTGGGTTSPNNPSTAVCTPAGTPPAFKMKNLRNQDLASITSKLCKKSESYYETPEINVAGLKGIFAMYKPQDESQFISAAIFENNINFNSFGIPDMPVRTERAVVIFAQEKLKSDDISKWSNGSLKKALSKMAPNPRAPKVEVDKNLSVYFNLANNSDEISTALKQLNLPDINKLTGLLRLTTDNTGAAQQSLTMMHWSDWWEPMGLKNSILKGATIKFEKTGTSKTLEVAGNLNKNAKDYVLWAAATKSPGAPLGSRAIGLYAAELTMQNLVDFADAVPFSGFSALNLSGAGRYIPLGDIKITNGAHPPSRPLRYVPGEFPKPNEFTILVAENDVAIPGTNKKGPLLYANGKAKILKWDVQNYKAEIDPRAGRLYVNSNIPGSLDPIPMAAGTRYEISVSANNLPASFIKFTGGYKILDLTLASTVMEISSNRIKLEVDTGCIPPAMKVSLNASYSLSAFNAAPGLSPSGCLESVGQAILSVPGAIGDGISSVANLINSGLSSLGPNQPQKAAEVSLRGQVLVYGYLIKVRDSANKAGVQRVNLTANTSFESVFSYWVSTSKLNEMISGMQCRIKGRTGALLVWSSMRASARKELDFGKNAPFGVGDIVKSVRMGDPQAAACATQKFAF